MKQLSYISTIYMFHVVLIMELINQNIRKLVFALKQSMICPDQILMQSAIHRKRFFPRSDLVLPPVEV